MLTKKEADKLIGLSGESRGMNIKIDLDYIFEKYGEKGIKKIEERIIQLGYPLKYKEIEPMGFYPVGLEAIVLVSIKDVFDLNEKQVEEMGVSVVKFSLFMKIFMKYLGSLALIANEIPKTWKEHYTIGKLIMPDFSDEKKYAIIREEGFKIHPVYCDIHKGYFSKVAQMVVKAPAICQETKCMFKGDPYHEFLLTW